MMFMCLFGLVGMFWILIFLSVYLSVSFIAVIIILV